MSSAAIRPSVSINQPRPAAASGGGVALDPVRLLKKYYTVLISAAIAGAILGGIAHVLLAKFAPQYTAVALFACYPQARNTENPYYEGMSQDELTRFMGTQQALMTSPKILDTVLDDVDVNRTGWAQQFMIRGNLQKQMAQPELEKTLSARTVPQTSLIRLAMTWRNPDDARTIVDAVARVYLAEVRESGSKESVGRREVLTSQINEIDADIGRLNAERDSILQRNSISDLAYAQSQEEVQIKTLGEQLVRARTDVATTRIQYSRYKQLADEGSIVQYPDFIREQANKDPVVQSLDQTISGYRTDYQSLKAQGYGDDHLTVIAIRKRIDAAQQERQESYDRAIRKMFDAEIDSLRSQMDSADAAVKQITADIQVVDLRKQDLLQKRIRLQSISEDVARRNDEKSHIETARKQIQLLAGAPVFDRVRSFGAVQRPQTMSFPKLEVLIPLGVMLLTGLTAGLVVLREVLDQRVRGPADLATMARIRVLGLVADAQEDPARPSNLATAFRDAPTGVTAESFRLLRAPLVKAMDQAGHRTLLLLGGMPGSGATTVATNLALACAGADERVLVIDANLRRPGIQRAFGLSDGPGLGDVLAGAAKLDDAARPTTAENLFVLTVGSAAHRALPERLASETMARLLAEAKTKYDRIIVDSAPAIVSGDGFALANRVDCVALVVRAMNEKRGLVARLRAQLGECHADFLGVIINAVRYSAGGYLRGNIKATHEYQHGKQAA